MLSAGQQRVVDHRDRPLLVLGAAGTGKSEALARRLAGRVEEGTGVRPEEMLILTRSVAAGEWLRSRVEELLEVPFEELWIGPYERIAERLLRRHAAEAGLDPFFETVTLADRLAALLDRLEELPLRRHEIRGNPAGLLSRLLQRVDSLKAEAVSASSLRAWASSRERAAPDAIAREAALREIEFADLYECHDRIMREAGSLDAGDLLAGLARLVADRPDVAADLRGRFREVMADEFEDTAVAHRNVLEALVGDSGGLVCCCDDGQAIRRYRGAALAAVGAFRTRHSDAEEVRLEASQRGDEDLVDAAAAVAAAIGERLSLPHRGRQPEDGPPRPSVRFWHCRNERAQAQAVAREVERTLASGLALPDDVCVAVGSLRVEGRQLAAALEERSIPFRLAGPAAIFSRPEVRDAIAWLRMLVDPGDAAAVVRALTRPPVQLRSVDVARCTTIARRRKLDMISALQAGLESPQLPQEARDRVQGFLKLYRAAAKALEELRADVFLQRLIERIGLRRHQLFAAHPETVERLVNLSRLGEIAAAWTRREPRGSTRDFVRYLTALADAGELEGDSPLALVGSGEHGAPGTVLLAEPAQLKGLEFRHVYLLGLQRAALAGDDRADRWIPDELIAEPLPEPGPELEATHRARLAYTAMSRASDSLVLSWHGAAAEGAHASAIFEAARAALGASSVEQEEELFGPAESIHSTYRMIRDEVLEASWRAGSALSEMRLDTAEDVDHAVVRFLELVKLAALVQRPGSEPTKEAIGAINELLRRVATPEQAAALTASALDQYLLEEELEEARRREVVAERDEPSLETFLPRRQDGLALSASDIELYRACPLKYKFARVFVIPQEPTINQRFGILIHNVLQRFHVEESQRGTGAGGDTDPPSLGRLLSLFEAGWRRSGFGSSDDELQYRDRAVAALTRYHERHLTSDSTPVYLERGFNFRIGPHQLRGRIDRVDQHPDGGFELIDYKTGQHKAPAELAEDLQLALYRIAAQEVWDIEASEGSYYYVLDDIKVPVPAAPDDRERVERTVLEVGSGILSQDFEPRPAYELCSWCDYRVICPASEA